MKKTPLKILIAPDKFKGSLSAIEVCEAIANGLRQKEEEVLDITFHPMADGGDDSLTILAEHLNLKETFVKTQDPLGRPITTSYFTAPDAAFIEVAAASGLVLLEQQERCPLSTSTLGTGQVVLDAILKGHQNIYLFLGGSATNDAGMGIAQALGFRFLDVDGDVLQPIGKNLSKIATIQREKIYDFDQIRLTLFYDVANPLYGINGAAHVYAPQKGASPEQVQLLDDGLVHFSKILLSQTGIDVALIAGCGAAGGIGAGLVALCGAQMAEGFEVISRLTHLEEKIQQADWVISGEGKLDGQSLQGKVVAGIAGLCRKHRTPLSLFVGKNELAAGALRALGVEQVFSVLSLAEDERDGMVNGAGYLESLAGGIDFSGNNHNYG